MKKWNGRESDYEKAESSGMSKGMLDRLALNPGRIQSMADGLLKVAALDDPVGEVISMKLRPNGLKIGQKRVPLGVIAMIYEARPNVTADAFGLCFKSGNAVILKGGSDALHSNIAIVASIRRTLAECGVDENAIALIEDTSRETTTEFMKMNGYVDVLIPRGGAGLIRAVVENEGDLADSVEKHSFSVKNPVFFWGGKFVHLTLIYNTNRSNKRNNSKKGK